MKIRNSCRRSFPSEWQAAEPAPRSHRALTILLVVIILLAALALAVPHVPGFVKDGSDLISRLVSSLNGPTGASTTEGLNFTVYSPLIQKGAANISYPSDYGALSSYVLSLVNGDRANYSVGPVSLGDGAYAQQHADSMLKYGYFSHNDTQGFKPYMRYTLLGGRGAVEENVAYAYASSPYFASTVAVESELKALEWTMMNNDSQCCNNGHRYNILSVLHNQVSVGVAFNGTRVYFVEDFENLYINLNFSVSDSYFVNMTGTPLMSGLSADAIYVAYDHAPIPETPAQLNSGPNEYSQGLLVGGVLPPCDLTCHTFENIITVHADTWVFIDDRVAVTFSLFDFIQKYGAGVYTIYLAPGADTTSSFTSISVFVD